MKKVLVELTDEQCNAIDHIAKTFRKSRVDIVRIMCEMMIGVTENARVIVCDNNYLRVMHRFSEIIDPVKDGIGIMSVTCHYNERIGNTYSVDGIQKIKFGGEKNV